MMDIFYKRFVLFSVLLTSISLFSQNTFTKKIEKTIGVSDDVRLYLDNKYGEINIKGWEKNIVAIIVNVKVTNKKEERAKSILDAIKVDIKESRDLIRVESRISGNKNGFFSRYFNNLTIGKSNAQIDYTIYLPQNVELDIINKFGDIILDDWDGELKVNMKHGDLWLNDKISKANIEMKYGKIRAKTIDTGQIILKNGSLDLQKSQNLLINSSGSKIEMNQIYELELISNKDDIIIEDVENLNGKVRFSNIKIENLGKEIELTMKLADLRILKIKQPDIIVSIDQESSDIDINITKTSFKFKAALEQGLLRLPKSFSNISNKVIDKGMKIREIKAEYGKSLSGTFNLVGKKGIIILKE